VMELNTSRPCLTLQINKIYSQLKTIMNLQRFSPWPIVKKGYAQKYFSNNTQNVQAEMLPSNITLWKIIYS